MARILIDNHYLTHTYSAVSVPPSQVKGHMFSGIVETHSSIKDVQARPGLMTIQIEKPKEFNDLKTGDSIAVDGVCLTLEAFDADSMTFSLGPESLRITGWTPEGVLNRVVNLERSLRLMDRIHGHLVTGHVDMSSRVVVAEKQGDSLKLAIEIPDGFRPYFWAKGSVAVNGVSLTINQVTADFFTVGLIPETLKRTNLAQLRAGDRVNLEIDNMARAFVRQQELEA